VRQVNTLRSMLREYCPANVAAFDNWFAVAAAAAACGLPGSRSRRPIRRRRSPD
jgi:hypothetical protein